MDERIQRLADLISAQTFERLERDYASPHEVVRNMHRESAQTHIHEGKKYIRVDIDTSGRYMIDDAGNIWGIKGYGVIHRGHWYGTLDTIEDYYWGGYVAVKKERIRRFILSGHVATQILGGR